MLGKRESNKIFLNIKNGNINRRTEQGTEEQYKYVEGRLISLTQRERTFRGEKVLYWYLDLWDDESGEIYSLGFGYSSNTFKSIVLQLASEDGLAAIEDSAFVRIEPYSRNGYDKVQVWAAGVKLDWVTKELPPIESNIVNGRRFRDDTERMNLICNLCNRIVNALPKA